MTLNWDGPKSADDKVFCRRVGIARQWHVLSQDWRRWDNFISLNGEWKYTKTKVPNRGRYKNPSFPLYEIKLILTVLPPVSLQLCRVVANLINGCCWNWTFCRSPITMAANRRTEQKRCCCFSIAVMYQN